MVKFVCPTVRLGLVSTVVLWGLVSAGNFPVAALPRPMILVSQMTVLDYLRRGGERERQKDFQGAISDYTAAIRLDPKKTRAYTSRWHVRYYSTRDFQGAISDLNEIIRIDPNDSLAYDRRGMMREEIIGDFKGAIADYEQMIRINPKEFSGYLGRGRVRLQMGDFQGAITDAEQVIQTENLDLNNSGYKSAFGYSLRGRVRFNMGDFQGAIADAEQQIQMNPQQDSGYRNRGDARKNLGDFQGAIADAEQIIRLGDLKSKFTSDRSYTSYTGYVERSEVYSLLKNYSAALSDANTAMQLYPKSGLAYAARGIALTGLNDYQGAQADFDRAIQFDQVNRYGLYTGSSFIFYWRGLLRLKQGKNQQAIEDYEKAIRLKPGLAKSKAYENYSLIARRQLNTPVASQPNPPAAIPNPQAATTAAIDPPKPTIPPSAPNLYKIAEATTLRIEGQNSGSGVLISKVGNTYYLLTAKHVVETQDTYTVIAPNGKKYPLDYSQVKKLANLDLAIAQFTSTENYAIAPLGNSEQINEGDFILVSGWTLTDPAIKKPSHLKTKGDISGFQKGDADGYELIYTNTTAPGMSGGPIFDSSGRLVGIHGRASGTQVSGKTGINLGIPINLFVEQVSQTGLNLKQLGLKAQR